MARSGRDIGTSLWVPSELGAWIRQEAARRNLGIAEFLAQATLMPKSFAAEGVPVHRAGRRAGPHSSLRKDLRELLVLVLDENGGKMRAKRALDEVNRIAVNHVPSEWHKPYGQYNSRTKLFAAFERKNLMDQGLLGSDEWGEWELTASGRKVAKELRAQPDCWATRAISGK